MKRKTIIKSAIAAIVVVALSCWIHSRWNAWFHNPEEPEYVPSMVPSRICLTFGNEGELSRYVSWVCDTVVDSNSCLFLKDGEDTLCVPAIGEVFKSRSGKAAFYRAEMTGLKANSEYCYAVQSKSATSEWYHFKVQNPDSSTFTFLFFGDVQDSLEGVANQLIKKAYYAHPEVDFLAFGGDFFERPIDSYFNEGFRSIDSLCTTMPIINIPGNHDYLKYLIRKCERRFALTFPYYLRGQEERDDENHLFSFRYHNTDFFLLDSDREFWYIFQQRCWLKKELDNSASQHKIVMIHHPLYSVKKKRNNLIQRWLLNDEIQAANVDLVLQGHEHGYTHNTSNEEPLLDSICTNRPLYTVSHCSPKTYRLRPDKRFSPVLSGSRYYQVIHVSSDTLTMTAYDANTGEQIDKIYILSNQ